MARRKFNYKYFVNNEETSKDEFIERLQQHHYKCDTYYDNPFMNISILDEKGFNKVFNQMKSNKIHSIIYCNDDTGKSECFSIKREEKK